MDYLSLIKQPIEQDLNDFIQLFNESLTHTVFWVPFLHISVSVVVNV